MKFEVSGQNLTIYLSGRIDSTNADSISAELSGIVSSNPHAGLVLDAEELQYISSAGLRIILKLRKDNPGLRIVEVSSEVYEIFDITGFTEMIGIEKAYRKMSVEGCKVLGQGSNGVVYRYDPEIVVKVYRNPNAIDDIKRERELARKALVLGIPTAIPFDVVRVGDRFASVFELLNARSFSSIIREEPEKTDHVVGLFSGLLRQIHDTEVKPEDMPDMKQTAVKWVEFLKDYLPEDSYCKLSGMVSAVPERHTMIHGDYHTNNVEMQNDEILLIEMDTLSWGHPVFELASMYLGFVGFGETDPTATEKFLGLPYATANYVWNRTLQDYLGTDDPARIKEVEDKARVMGYTRLMRRTIRRESDTEAGQKLIAHCREKLLALLETVDTLDF